MRLRQTSRSACRIRAESFFGLTPQLVQECSSRTNHLSPTDFLLQQLTAKSSCPFCILVSKHCHPYSPILHKEINRTQSDLATQMNSLRSKLSTYETGCVESWVRLTRRLNGARYPASWTEKRPARFSLSNGRKSVSRNGRFCIGRSRFGSKASTKTKRRDLHYNRLRCDYRQFLIALLICAKAAPQCLSEQCAKEILGGKCNELDLAPDSQYLPLLGPSCDDCPCDDSVKGHRHQHCAAL